MNRLHREGCLKPGYSGSCRWTRDGEPLATIGLHASPDRLRLEYRRLGRDDAWEQIAYDVPLTWSPCTKGGARPYFLCPAPLAGRPCRRRVAKLYLRGRHFLCRHCQDLAYESQSEDAHGRLLRRKETLRQSMGGEPGSSPHLLPARRLTPRQFQSGESDRRGKITRCGDSFTRTALSAAANVMLSRSQQWTALKAWGVRLAQRSSLKKAKIAVARKLAVIMHRMWKDNSHFRWAAEA